MQVMDRPPEPRQAAARNLLLALNSRADFSRAAICRLGSELELWRGAPAADRELARQLSMDMDTLSKALDLRADAEAVARRQFELCERWRAETVTRFDVDYPSSLLELELPPPVLHFAGDLRRAIGDRGSPPLAGSTPAVAIVGSRRASSYGIEVATWLGKELARAGATVVSGFARGVDAAAHRGALQAENGSTIAVLGCGLGVDYPRGHRPLEEEIRARGALLSEFPCASPPESRNFPIRNRIIANLASATVVVEAAPRSGSLVTARLALEAGREVFAVPGRITDELALGTNELLRDGAGLVSHPSDLFEALGWAAPRSSAALAEKLPPPGLRAAEAALFAALDAVSARPPDEVALAASLSIDETLRGLLDLELAGHVVRVPGGAYRRR